LQAALTSAQSEAQQARDSSVKIQEQLLEPDSLLEVRPIFHILLKDAMAWANREAKKQFRKK
jgi:hypothetical protein